MPNIRVEARATRAHPFPLTLPQLEAIAASLNMQPEDLLLTELRGTAA